MLSPPIGPGPTRPATGSMPSGSPILSMQAGGPPNLLLSAAGAASPAAPVLPVPQQSGAPQPPHEQTAAMIHHVAVVQKHLRALLADPRLGHEDCSAEIARVQVDLLTSGILNVRQVSEVMGTVPRVPAAQKHWVESKLMDGLMVQNRVLDDHRAAFRGTGDFASESARHPMGTATHEDLITRAISHYRR